MITKTVILITNNIKPSWNAGKKQQMILEMQDYWNSPPKKSLKADMEKFQVSKRTARKYVDMTKEEIQRLDMPHDYKKKDSPMNGWLNVIYKMMQDGHHNETIYFYIRRQPDFSGSDGSLARCIHLIGKNNFSGRSEFHPKQLMEQTLPPGVACFKRTEILKYLLTCNPKVKKNEELGKYIDAIKEKYPTAAWVESTFKEFHGILMGNETDKIDEFIETYGESKIKSFCNGKNRISPRSRTRYPILKVLDLLKETTTNSNSSNVLYMEEAD